MWWKPNSLLIWGILTINSGCSFSPSASISWLGWMFLSTTPLSLQLSPVPSKQRASDAIRMQSSACGFQGKLFSTQLGSSWTKSCFLLFSSGKFIKNDIIKWDSLRLEFLSVKQWCDFDLWIKCHFWFVLWAVLIFFFKL